MSGKFYILDSRTVVGNCVMWWCPDGQGYTCDLNAAGVYDAAEATSKRDTDVAVPVELARKLAISHVRIEHLRDALDIIGVKIPPMMSGKRGRR